MSPLVESHGSEKMNVMNSSSNMSIETSSSGAWQGDNPFRHAFPLLMLQTIIVLFTTRLLTFLLKPLHQPRVVAEIVGGILLGPSGIGRSKVFLQLVFPSWSTPILESVAGIGLLYFLFLVGLELDISAIRRSGRRAFGIAVAGVSLPFIFSVGVSFILRKAVHSDDKVSYAQYLLFIGVALSVTAFPVLARILAELKLLTTQVGETAMAAAAINDVAAWILLALAVAVSGNGSNPLVSVWILISGAVFVVVMLTVVPPLMSWLAKQSSSERHTNIDDASICLTLAGVMISGFITDLIGIHSIFGGFVFGLAIPKHGGFAGKLIKRIEDLVTNLMLPLYFASSGLKTDVWKIHGAEAWALVALVVSTASAGKILGTFVVSMLCMIPARESLAMGVLMNTKGLVELIVLNIGKERKVLNDEMFAILVLMALLTTFMTTPAIMAIYKPARRTTCRPNTSPHHHHLRVLACVRGPEDVPVLITLIDTIRSSSSSSRPPLELFVMHLVELTDLSSSILMVQKTRKNGFPFISNFRGGTSYTQIVAAFEAYRQLGRVSIHHLIGVSALSTMHDDICHVAEEKSVTMILLPFHKQCLDEGEPLDLGPGWRQVNQRVMASVPCSVAVLINRGFCDHSPKLATEEPTTSTRKNIGILLVNGADDREALKLGGRMAEHESVRVSLIKFVSSNASTSGAEAIDAAAVREFMDKWEGTFNYIERSVSSPVDEAVAIARTAEYELLVVGAHQMGGETANAEAEQTELGSMGNILASASRGIVPSVLVVRGPNAEDTVNLPEMI